MQLRDYGQDDFILEKLDAGDSHVCGNLHVSDLCGTGFPAPIWVASLGDCEISAAPAAFHHAFPFFLQDFPTPAEVERLAFYRASSSVRALHHMHAVIGILQGHDVFFVLAAVFFGSLCLVHNMPYGNSLQRPHC